jgi:cytochrome P450
MTEASLFAIATGPDHRADPYPLYAKLREFPVLRQADGTYVATTFKEIRSLLFDERVSSDDLPLFKHPKTGNLIMDFILNPIRDRMLLKHRPLLFRDPPEHDVLRRRVMTQFTPERVQAMRGRAAALVEQFIDGMRGRGQVDFVGDFAYPLPVTVICEMLGVPPEDEKLFHAWSRTLAGVLDPDQRCSEQYNNANVAAYDDIGAYLEALIKAKRKCPKDDLLSGLANDKDKKTGRINKYDLIATAMLLLVAGHETTVNLLANAMLTLLRHPEHFARLRRDPRMAARVVDEVLRFDPPVHFRTRKTLSDIEIAGIIIPRGAPLVLLFASGNRDPKRFRDPDRFDPDRADPHHFGFGGGIHYCLGAQLARLEAEIALTALAKRLIDPSLILDPPPYRAGAALRGPERLDLRIGGIAG